MIRLISETDMAVFKQKYEDSIDSLLKFCQLEVCSWAGIA